MHFYISFVSVLKMLFALIFHMGLCLCANLRWEVGVSEYQEDGKWAQVPCHCE
jgi:hypothetical protein